MQSQEPHSRPLLLVFSDSMHRDSITLTSPLSLVQGYEAILAYCPVQRNGDFDGFLVGIFALDDLFSGVVFREIADEFGVVILDHGKPLYHSRLAAHAKPGAAMRH